MAVKHTSQADPTTTPSSAAPAPSTTPQSLLIEWANQQDNWVRALVSEIIETRQELPEARVQHYYDLLLREKELAPGVCVDVPLISGTLKTAAAGDGFALAALRETQNINALTPAQGIDFNARMTILFGENASGKTGYVRILNRVAAVRTAETVLPNVMSPTAAASTPKAQLTYQLGPKTETDDAGTRQAHWRQADNMGGNRSGTTRSCQHRLRDRSATFVVVASICRQGEGMK